MKSIKEYVVTLDCKNLLECMFGLSDVDLRVYESLQKLGEAKIEEISREVGRGENTVYKSLQRLIMAGLTFREKKILNGGGYYFIYKPVPRERVAEEVKRLTEEWCERVRRALEEFLK
jgi:predicted transcriptional regulator